MKGNSGYDVCIIGAGIGGLSSAGLLAKQGFKVIVLEGLDRLGGCCSNRDFNGFKPDVGAVFVLWKFIYDTFFRLMNLRIEDYIELKLIDPVYEIVLKGSDRHLIPRDPDAMAEVVRRISPADVPNFRRYSREMQKISDAQIAACGALKGDLKNMCSLSTLKKVMSNRETIAALSLIFNMATKNLGSVIDDYFRDERIRMLFLWESIYVGLAAHRTSGLFAFLANLSHEGYYYPKGGMIAIPQGLANCARKFGAEIRLHSPVKKILLKNRRAYGVELQTGEIIESKVVISNTHSRHTYLNLVGPTNLPSWAVKTVKRQPCSMPCPVFYLMLKERLNARAHMTVLLPSRRKFDDFWSQSYDKELLHRPDDGYMQAMNPTISDPELAPFGKDIVSVIYAAPYKLKYYDWDTINDEWTWELIHSLERRAFPGLTSKIESIEKVSPPMFEKELNVAEGGFVGLELTLSNLGLFRPSYKSKLIDNLYLVGQCTNPGGGVAQVLVSGILCSSVVTKTWPK